MDDSDTLITRTLSGDSAAYGELVRRFEDMAYGYAYSVLGDFHLAQDAAQEAFVEAHAKLADLRVAAAFPGWLRRIVLKHCDRLIRKKRVPTVPLASAAELGSGAPGADTVLAAREMQEEVLRLVSALPEQERLAITLFHLGEHSLREVAEFLEVPVTTVKNRLHSSRKKLKEQMMSIIDETFQSHPLPARFADVVLQMNYVRDRVNPLAVRMKSLTAGEMRQQTAVLRQRLADGEQRDVVKADAFALVREAARRALQQSHYDVQLVASMILDEGWVAETCTGEGKTIICFPAAYMAVLEGMHVHVTTVNDYLARRDAALAKRVFDMLDVTVGQIDHNDKADHAPAYGRDVTYGCWSAFLCAYVKAVDAGSDAEIPLDVAILDEIDSVLIDNASTPVSTPSPTTPDPATLQRADEIAKRLLHDSDHGTAPAFHVDPKHRWSIILTDTALAEVDADDDQRHNIEQAIRANLLYCKGREYVVEDGKVWILDQSTGRPSRRSRFSEGLHQAIEVKEGVAVTPVPLAKSSLRTRDYYRRYRKLAGLTGSAAPQAAEFQTVYGLNTGIVPTRRDLNRIDHDDRVCADTDRMHNAVLAEVLHYSRDLRRPVLVRVRDINESERLSAMLTSAGIEHELLNADPRNAQREGEIVEAAGELRPLVPGGRKLVGAVTVATNMAGRGTDIRVDPRAVCRDCRVPGARKLKQLGVDKDELHPPGTVKCCLSCSDYDEESNCAGCFKSKLSPEFPRRGRTACRLEVPCGLHVIGVGRQGQRTDNQLRARAGRQGDPGSCRFFLSMEDDLVRAVNADDPLPIPEGQHCLESLELSAAIKRAQQRQEEHESAIRVELASLGH